MSEDQIILQSSDGEPFTVDVKAASLFGIVKTYLEVLEVEPSSTTKEVVPLPKVRGEVLKKIISWAKHHADDLERVKEETANCTSVWDVEFLKMPTSFLFEVILAANYLDIQDLMKLCCRSVANMIKYSKNVAEIRTKLRLPRGGLPLEIEQHIMKENELLEQVTHF